MQHDAMCLALRPAVVVLPKGCSLQRQNKEQAEGPTGVVTVVFCDTAPLLLLLEPPLVTVPASFPAQQMQTIIP